MPIRGYATSVKGWMITNREIACTNYRIPKRTRSSPPAKPREHQSRRGGTSAHHSIDRGYLDNRYRSSNRRSHKSSPRERARTLITGARVPDSRTPTGSRGRNAVTPPPPIPQAWELELYRFSPEIWYIKKKRTPVERRS